MPDVTGPTGGEVADDWPEVLWPVTVTANVDPASPGTSVYV